MDLDVNVSRWILELLLTDRDLESVAKQFLAVEPLSDQDWRLKKVLLLRTMESQIFNEVSVSETILDLLETIEILDRRQGIPVTDSDSLRAAYCGVARECTVKFLVAGRGKPSGQYMEAVDRIWRGRVRALEESEGCELVTVELKETRDEVEAAIWDLNVSNKLARMNTRNDALRLLALYVHKALATLDSLFIACSEANCGPELEAQRVDEVNGVSDRSEQANDTNVADDTVELQVPGAGRSPPKEKESSRSRALRRRHGPVGIRDNEDVATEALADIYDTVASADVRKKQEELMSSVSAVRAVVTGPVPYALHMSEFVRSELGMRPLDHVSGENGGAPIPSVEKNSEPDQSIHGNQTSHQNDVPQPSRKENGAPKRSVDKAGKGTEYVQTSDTNPGNPSSSYQNIVSRSGLMQRNSTAQTFEWDCSVDMSPERTNSRKRLHLPSPKRNAVSPLKKYEDKRVIRRRMIKRWSLHEEDTLRTGVQKYGKGNWKFILNTYQDVFQDRTEVDLKDKWRNMTK